MNPLDYGTREACQQLADAGIVMKTAQYIAINRDTGGCAFVSADARPLLPNHECIPAPSFGEIWRELCRENSMHMENGREVTAVWCITKDIVKSPIFENINPTDALIALRIWLEGKETDDGR